MGNPEAGFPGEMAWVPLREMRPDPDSVITVRDADAQRAYGVVDALGWYPPIVYNGMLHKIVWGEHIREALAQKNAPNALCLVVALDEIEHRAAAIALHQSYFRLNNEALEASVLWLEKEGFDCDYAGIPSWRLDQIRGVREPKKRAPKVCPKCGASMDSEPEHDHA